MDELDLRVRRHVYRRFVELGRAPRVEEVATELELPLAEAGASLRRLHEAHALVLLPDRLELMMANPFAAIETPHRVRAGGRSWYAVCAWDSLGIPAALGVDGHVSSRCACCDEAIEIDVVGRAPVPDAYPVHLLVPARHWWDDIAYT